MSWRAPPWRVVRDILLFFGGMAGILYETVWRRPPDYGLLPIFAAMVGLPAFIRQDHDEVEPPEQDQIEPKPHRSARKR